MTIQHPTIATVPPPHAGEAFTSWMNRLAAANQMPLYWALAATGLTDRHSHTAKPKRYGYALTDTEMATLTATTGLPYETVEEMLMRSWAGTHATSVDRRGRDISENSRLFALHNWLYVKGSHYCPQCLHETGGAWQLDWKLPWTFTCTQHERFLLSHCPTCSQRADYGRADGSLAAPFSAHVPVPGACHNPRKQERHRGSRGPCLHNHAHDPNSDTTPTWILNLQQQILNEPREHAWWRDLRALASYALNVQTSSHAENLLGQSLPHTSRQAWDDQYAARTIRLEETRAEMANGLDHRRASKDTVARTPPTNPHLMAAATAVAYACATSDDHLAALLDDGRRFDITKASPVLRLRGYRISDELNARASAAYLGDRAQARSQGLLSRYTGPSTNPPEWNPNHLPGYLWNDTYDQHLANHFNELPLLRDNCRKFAVIALDRLARGDNWLETNRRYVDSVCKGEKMYSRVLWQVRRVNPNADTALFTAISDLAHDPEFTQRVNANPERSKRLRSLLKQRVPKQVYAKGATVNGGVKRPIQRKTHITHLRRQYAAVWLWTQLADEPAALAPAWPQRPTSSQLDTYKAWLNDTQPSLLRHLLDWANSST